ncbi:transcription antitermination factor NusB [Rubrimonas cliftonensis]|uniref:Transcription antitermination protein NusB n=1 Tax=Rubrimonas cliftonensis TaxID=89524 RepID=A0A1H4FMJ5_9RHOB|nr:transcription antitermination factor NusB [Rubrimonas cliftonensis]SEA98524.1 NusB antitermination factor [Rubrimonas cliftonensis]
MAERDTTGAEGAGTEAPPDRKRMRSAARLGAVQALYQMEMTGATLKGAEVEFESRWLGAEIEGEQYHAADVKFFRRLLRAAVDRQAEIDQLTDAALVERWPLGRIDPTLRALFRAAGAELLALPTPPKVAINEFVEVAKAFFDAGKEARFVNGVLDHVARAAKPAAFPA